MSAAGILAPSPGRIIITLGVLLVLQIAFGTLLLLRSSSYLPAEATSPLMSCDFGKIEKVVFEERQNGGTTKLVLAKEKGGWVLPECYGFPAAQSTVTQLLDSLKETKKGLPVTATKEALERFKVTAENFTKAINLYDGQNKVTTLYLGSSSGFRAVYARTPENNEIYTIEIPEYLVTTKADDWIDRHVLRLNANDLVAVDMGSFQLKKSKAEKKWALVHQEKTTTLHDSVADELIDALANLSVNSALGTKMDGEAASILTVQSSLKEGRALTYAFSRLKDKGTTVVKASDKPWYMAVDEWSIKRLKEVTPASLLKREADEMTKEQKAKADEKRKR
ncbi:MAG TPA: DUF4340 domain-containing protein [Candidatus Obscuribacterales bacterium]